MKLRRLTRTERKVWQAAVTDTEVNLRVGDSQLDAPIGGPNGRRSEPSELRSEE